MLFKPACSYLEGLACGIPDFRRRNRTHTDGRTRGASLTSFLPRVPPAFPGSYIRSRTCRGSFRPLRLFVPGRDTFINILNGLFLKGVAFFDDLVRVSLLLGGLWSPDVLLRNAQACARKVA